MLRFTDVSVRYGAGVRAVDDVSLVVPDGAVVAVIGGNGAGKTTLMRAASGTLAYHGGTRTSGTIELAGTRIERLHPHRIVAEGLALVPEGRHVFGELSIEENLLAGAATVRKASVRAERLDRSYAMFEVLGRRRAQHAGLLSGGEQQMLAIARGLMSGPRILLLDEPSLGLAPQAVSRIASALTRINADGTTIVLVEQNAAMALGIADEGVVLERGVVSLHGPAQELRDSEDITRMYLGGSSDDEDEAPIRSTATLGRWEE
ncbi:ABC transporter ATP-binding protein [Microbacterium sp. No. 7]|uniref:ABC transporter ATP-binding protein n=1 Tax=Microbacterium sp. No. 7 TaxID=1714373 RepID=UPI0006CF580E|nr:ABC transporter ATP-binding protein [Microbacterium sp. No. 7]ALJ21794.1 branched-chain amino acid ABC transporter ATP-binding protein [Microbacterium sp. No. 7]